MTQHHSPSPFCLPLLATATEAISRSQQQQLQQLGVVPPFEKTKYKLYKGQNGQTVPRLTQARATATATEPPQLPSTLSLVWHLLMALAVVVMVVMVSFGQTHSVQLNSKTAILPLNSFLFN